MEVSSKRAKNIAILALIFHIIFFIASWILGLRSNAFAMSAVSWQFLAGGMIWFVLIVLFHQQNLADQEKLDMAQLAKARESGTIFQAEEDRNEAFAVASKRLGLIIKWFLPIWGIIIAIFYIGMGSYLFRKAMGLTDVEIGLYLLGRGDWEANKILNPQLTAFFAILIAFVSFLLSMYSIGLSKQTKWKPLRSGSSNLLASSILMLLVGGSLALAQFKFFFLLAILNWTVPVVMIVLGLEIVFNSILDVYRPRLPGRYNRPSFDSRLLGLISEPGGIFNTVASTIDYQFGFKVSQTWFYQLIEKAILPLLLFLFATLYLLSAFLVVGPDEQAVVEHFGKPKQVEEGSFTYGPGLHFKWPWPIDKAYKQQTEKIQNVNIGFVQKNEDIGSDPLIWGEKHYEEEYHLLVATEEKGLKSSQGEVPVSIVLAAVPIHYKIKDLYSYLYNFSNKTGFMKDSRPHIEKMIESIAYRQVVKYAASAKIETENDDDPNAERYSILGKGRMQASEDIKNAIQQQADLLGLGIEIVLVNLQGIHPPVEVTEEYQKVVASVQMKQALILDAEAERNSLLANLCGSVEMADLLFEQATMIQYRNDEGNSTNTINSRIQLNKIFSQAKGDVFQKLRESVAYKFEKATLAEATGKRFQKQIIAYKASPDIYAHLQRLLMLEDTLQQTRKYIIVANEDDEQVFIVDLKESLTSDLYDMELLQEDQ